MLKWLPNPFKKTPPVVIEVQDRITLSERPFDRESQIENPLQPVNFIEADKATAAYTFSPDLYAVINLKARMISSLPLKLYWKKENGEKTERVTGPIIDLLENPNPNTTKTQLIQQYASWHYLTGDAFMVMEHIEDVLYLFVLDTRWVRPIIDGRFGMDGIVYFKHKGKEIYYSRDQIIRWTMFNPNDDFFGMSPVQALSEDIQARKSAIRQAKNHYKKGGLSGGILVVPENLDDGLLKQLKQDWNRRTEDSSRLIVIEDGWDFREIEGKEPNISAESLLKMTREAVCNAYGVPVSLLDPDKNSHPEEAEVFCWNSTIIPEARCLGEILTQKVVSKVKTGPRLRIVLEFDETNVPVLQKYKIEQTKVTAVELSLGYKTPDQRLAEEDLPPTTIDLEGIPDEGLNAILMKFGTLPRPVFDALVAAKSAEITAKNAAASAGTLPGSMGGRDQSASGEPAMIDQTGRR